MNKRPRSITIVSWIFVASGCIALVTGLTLIDEAPARLVAEFKAQRPVELWLIVISGVSAIVGGVFMLYGFNWARWLLVVWFAFHVILSVLHSLFELVVHSLLFVAVLYLLFRAPASRYFRGPTTAADTTVK